MDNLDLTSDVAAAIERIRSTLQTQAPFLSHATWQWMRQISPNGDPASHFTHLRMFPLLKLPEWMVETLPVRPDSDFQHSLIHSSINGYYYVRLTDDVMDGDRDHKLELSILPATGFFCSQFQIFYQAYFPSQHVFWQKFHELWIAFCESAAHDASLTTVSGSDFERVSSRKYSAAGIPVAAACYHYDRVDLLTPWLEFTQSLARWSQMLDDMLDWYWDRRDQRATYFLSEGKKRKCEGESLDEWIAREGFAWGFGMLDQWMGDLREKAGALGSSGLRAYLGRREAWLQQQKLAMQNGFAAISQLATILQQAPAFEHGVSGEHDNSIGVESTHT
jgi:hypothetical protein